MKKFQNNIELDDLKLNLETKQEILDRLSAKNKQLYNENMCLKRDKDNIEKEKDEALTRLSKIAGQRLTNDNPDITDLSNPNRPAKIAERWSSLYTDEWTDAYEVIYARNTNLANKDPRPEIQLLKIVDWCYLTCKEIAETLNTVITAKLWDLVKQIHFLGNDSSTIVLNTCQNQNCAQEIQVLVEAMEPFSETVANQRRSSSSLIQSVINKCCADYRKLHPLASSEEEIRFVKKCSELCWFICTTEPSMIIEYKNTEETSIDITKFNHYNRSGKIVQFVIWPVLLLYEDGPVLAKGTAQTNDEIKETIVPIATDTNVLNNKENGIHATAGNI